MCLWNECRCVIVNERLKRGCGKAGLMRGSDREAVSVCVCVCARVRERV